MSEKLSQENAARIMYAAEKWVGAVGVLTFTPPDRMTERAKEANAAKAAFADLIATLTDSEGL